MPFFSAGGAKGASSNPLAGFEGPLQQEKVEKGRGRKGRTARDRKNTLQNKILVTALPY